MNGDERLRLTEHRWLATGAVEDEAAWLVERLRSGRLERRRAELAAFLGYPAACRARGKEARSAQLRSLLKRLPPWALGWAAVVAAEHVVPVWRAARPGDKRPDEAIANTRRYLSAASSAERKRLRPSLDDGADGVTAAVDEWSGGSVDHRRAPRAFFAARAALATTGAVGRRARECLEVTVKHALRVTSERELAQAIRCGVASWALGYEARGFEVSTRQRRQSKSHRG